MFPFPRNEDVVDRPDIFRELERLLPASARTNQSAALWGLGGSGKTQIALEYAYRRARDPTCAVLWVHAENETTFTLGYKEIAERLGLLELLAGHDLLAVVRNAITTFGSYLLVIDNVDDLRLFGFIPHGSGTVLWTSRDRHIRNSLVGPRRALEIGSMSYEEAQSLFEIGRNKCVEDEETEDVKVLLAELDRLPLAISQASAYLYRTSKSTQNYLSKLSEGRGRWRLLQNTEPDRYRRPNSPLTYKVLMTFAFLDYRLITGELLRLAIINAKKSLEEANTGSTEWSQDGHGDNVEDDVVDDGFIEVCTRLLEFSFLTQGLPNSPAAAYEMHKLVQEALRYRLSQAAYQQEQRHFSKAAFLIINSLFPEERKTELWDRCETYLLWDGELETSELLVRVLSYLFDRGRGKEKEIVDRTAYEYRKKVLGDSHSLTVRCRAEVATSYYLQGRYDEAEKIEIEVLDLRRQALGDHHPDTIHNLRRQVLGHHHPNTIDSMAQLASTYYGKGRYNEAEKIDREVLDLRREVLGDHHPDTIDSMAQLASIYHGKRQYDEAEEIHTEVLDLRRQLLGDHHPNTIQSMVYLASTWYAQGRYKEAEKIQREALALQRQVLGDHHPNTAKNETQLRIYKRVETPTKHTLEAKTI
ncbi:hypothetical protein GQ53DRAFT_782688 [Thozetella sp. PMI_491]|nr:hypothetical protein GQ53DRAFT_782688 [Thozetella sp. PMI_491]